MRLFLDTNVVLATIVDDADTADGATRLLDEPDHEFATSVFTVMELRAVLTKRQRLSQDRVEGIVGDLVADVDVFLPDSGDVTDAVTLQQDTLLYPMDALILACAQSTGATLVTFDAELQEHGAVPPRDVLCA